MNSVSRELTDRRQAGISLLAMIALIAILGIFAAVSLRALLRETDVEVARHEAATLRNYHQALQTAVMREGYIPSANPPVWVGVVATNAGASTNEVAKNRRRNERILLTDPSSTVPLSTGYLQSNAGQSVKPANVRIMIVSSLGNPLPLSNGQVLSSADFSALWSAAEGTTNFPNWAGDYRDVKIQRIDLTPFFVKVYISTQPAPPTGWFAVGANAPSEALVDTYPLPRYFLQGTVLRLHNSAGSIPSLGLDSTLVLNRDAFLNYENGMWKASDGVKPGGVDLAAIVRDFLAAAPNYHAKSPVLGNTGPLQQRVIVEAMINYMRYFNAWRGGDSSAYYYLVTNAQPRMIGEVRGLYLYDGNASKDCYPINTDPCP